MEREKRALASRKEINARSMLKPKPIFQTVSEIEDRTGLTSYTVRKWLKEFCALKLVEKRSQGKVVECGGLHVPELYVMR